MNRQELIEALETHCHEVQADLALSTQALNLLRNGIYAPEAAAKLKHTLRNSPIVYGKGYNGAPKRTRDTSHTPQGKAKAAIQAILKAHPRGMTAKAIENQLTALSIPFTRHTVHNSLRSLKITSHDGPMGPTGHLKVYRLGG